MFDRSHFDTAKVWLRFADEEVMFKRASEINFIAVTLVLVLLLGARTFMSLTEEEDFKTDAAIAAGPSTNSLRAPASLPTVSDKPRSALEQFTQFDLLCAKKSAHTVSVQGNFVQFHGKSCDHGLALAEVEIINKSNGYTGSIFPKGDDQYQTDLIQLQNGENEITIRYHELSGKQVEEVIKVHSTKI